MSLFKKLIFTTAVAVFLAAVAWYVYEDRLTRARGAAWVAGYEAGLRDAREGEAERRKVVIIPYYRGYADPGFPLTPPPVVMP